MPSTPLPAAPLVGLIIGVVLIGTGLVIRMGEPQSLDQSVDLEFIETADASVTPLTYHDQTRAQGFSSITQQRSPFVQDRSAFSRVVVAAPKPVAPELTPEFIGTLGKGEAVQAMILWKPGSPVETHSLGDTTPWGELISATSSELVFDDGKKQRRLRLF